MIFVVRESREPLYMQIYQQLKKEIVNGIMKEGDMLAGSRGLAKTLSVSRNTVDSAYSQLLAEGYITPKKGLGYAVTSLPVLKLTPKGPSCAYTEQIVSDDEIPRKKDVIYDLTNGSHTNDLFPKTLWRKYTLECLDLLDRENKLASHLDQQGELYLRQNLLSYLARIRGVRCNENQMIITCGIQQSLDYLCSLFSDKKVCVIMEEPGYHKAAAVFQNNGLDIRTVPTDENGLVVTGLPVQSRNYVIYSTPSHQFPTGVTMPIKRRLELLQWVKDHNAYILEDDFDSELRYYARPIPSLQSIDEEDRVIYLGTFSKALSPAIRMGYMILPPQLLKLYLDKFGDYNSTAPVLNQYIIARLIETGEYDRHIRRLNHVFRKRLERFNDEFSDVKDKVKISGNGSGQYFLLEFSSMADQEKLINKAMEYGVRVYPTMQFWQEKADCPPNTIFLGFSKIDLKDIPDCVRRLKTAWSEWL